MRLEPATPPGRATRKARGFHREILRLRGEGYTLGAIREALAEAGVRVSRSTVYREALRRLDLTAPNPPTPAPTPSGSAPVLPSQTTRPVDAERASTPVEDVRRGKDIAREFFEGRITNPLLLSRGQR